MSTSSTALQHPCPVWQGASGQVLAVQGCLSPGSRFRWGWGCVLSRGQQALCSMGHCASDNPVLRALQDTAYLCPHGKEAFCSKPLSWASKSIHFYHQ